MFERIGKLVTRVPIPVVIAWIVLGVVTIETAPEWSDVSLEGEFTFLPEDSASRQAEALYRRAFPSVKQGGGEGANEVRQDPLGSNVAIVVNRDDLPDGLTSADKDFVIKVLRTGLEVIQVTTPFGYADSEDAEDYVARVVRPLVKELAEESLPGRREDRLKQIRLSVADQSRDEGAEAGDETGGIDLSEADYIVSAVRTFRQRGIGPLLISPDQKSTLVVVEVKTEFLDRENGLLLDRIEAFVRDIVVNRDRYAPAPNEDSGDAESSAAGEDLRLPANLQLAISGSATVGRDMLRAEKQSTANTERWTKVLVIVLLLVIYRAPLLVVIPLVTVGLTVELTMSLLLHMAALGWIEVFSALRIYVTVVVYGAGIDFCLFLISRYKEELDGGASFDDAISRAIERVGIALATSAGTSIAGIGMMMFAEFGKFPKAGFSISFGLLIVLCCALTLTPALLHFAGRWAFWPDVRQERISAQKGWIPTTSAWSLVMRDKPWTKGIWNWIASVIEQRPGRVFLVTVAMMTPFVMVACANYNRLSYGLLSELRPDVTSVVGAKAVQEHFPPGITGLTTVLLMNDQFNFGGRSGLRGGEEFAEALTEELSDRAGVLGISDVRSQSSPIGIKNADAIKGSFTAGLARNFAHATYVSSSEPLAGKVVRVDLVFENDPFTRESIGRLTPAENAVIDSLSALQERAAEMEDDEERAMYESLVAETEVYILGPTASLRDLKEVTDRDRVTIAVLVSIAVYLVLVALLGKPAISLYLIVTVVFSFLVTLGVTHCVFMLQPGPYNGMDWKAPIFVFTILVAMGEDYNVLLMSRVDEEQRKLGPVKGVLAALTKTGGIISSCGIIMAGTFASLTTGTLTGIVQLGFALAFGVLLDTFVVRPILVPSYLVLLYQGRFGKLGRWLGYTSPVDEGNGPASTDEVPSPTNS